MESKYSVTMKEIAEKFQLETIFLPHEEDVLVTRSEVNRPGLALAGFFGHFEPNRIQLIGKNEFDYISHLSDSAFYDCFDKFFNEKPVVVIFTNTLPVSEIVIELARKHGVPIYRTSRPTSDFLAALVLELNVYLAPRMTRHGVLVEVYGEGILILGDSGVGKSETAIELVKRGHRLIADDAVEIKRVSDKTLVGSAPKIIRHYVELRGIGIVDVRRIFGMGAVKDTEKIDMIIKLEPWVQGKMYDRLGMDSEYTDMMGINVPTTTIPVKPGRNLAIILEIAAMNNRQKKMGYNTAVEFNKMLMGEISSGEMDR